MIVSRSAQAVITATIVTVLIAPARSQPLEVKFPAGRHRIGTDVPAGRYYADPDAGCYWERHSGAGGAAADPIAFEYVGFDAAQWVVDIAGSDHAFQANTACGTWSNVPRHGVQDVVPPGLWVVGAQVAPGTYRSRAAAGCYWERLSDLTGEGDAVIASGLAPSDATVFVTLTETDRAFSTDTGCGTWTPLDEPGVSSGPVAH